MRSSLLFLLSLSISSAMFFACTKQVKAPARKVLSYGKDYINKWQKINKSKVISQHHGNTEKNVFANEDAYKVFMGKKKPPYPVGAKFLVEHYREGEKQGFIYLMEKMGADYDPDRGNWKYVIVRVADWTIEQQGLIANCVKCHEKGANSDYIRLDKKLFVKSSPF